MRAHHWHPRNKPERNLSSRTVHVWATLRALREAAENSDGEGVRGLHEARALIGAPVPRGPLIVMRKARFPVAE
jgi:hypothetical protein